jgi:hypothetical protein
MIDCELLDEEYPHLGGSKGFIKSVIDGPSCLFGGFHQHAIALKRLWGLPREKRGDAWPILPDDAPIYLPHLAIICLAWTIDSDELEPNAFYDRLAKIVPEHDLELNQRLRTWEPLWRGLEEWSSKLQGRRGVFQVECLGHMAHVGKPRSQVILTPTRIKRLPKFFVTTGIAEVHDCIDNLRLRAAILGFESISRSALGNMLYIEILNNTEIGQAAVSRLLELLKDPDFRSMDERPPEGRTKITGSDNRTVIKLQLRLVLECAEHHVGWRCRFGFLGTPPEADPGQTGWSLRKVDQKLGGLWLARTEYTGDDFIDAVSWGKPFHDGFKLSLQGSENTEEDQIEINYPSRCIHIFPLHHWFGETRLVEGDNLPTDGACYLLITAQAQARFTEWRLQFEGLGGKVSDYTRSGLPETTTFLYLEGLELINGNLRKSFPEPTIARADRKASLFLTGGSRLPSIAGQRVYLPYDPPDLLLVGQETVEVFAKGAALVEILQSLGRPPSGLPGVPTRQYRIELEPEATRVEIGTRSNAPDWIPERLIFGVGRNAALGAAFDESLSPRFDKFGRRVNEPGILGPWIDDDIGGEPPNRPFWVFEEMELDLGSPVTETDLDHRGWKLCESLSLKTRVISQEFRRRVEKILNWWPQHAWAEARWLRALCHVEIERDNRGRLAYVYSVPSHGYLLPWKADGSWLVALGGCPNRNQLAALIDAAEILDVRLFSKERNSELTPPRWLCVAHDIDAIELALEEAGIRSAIRRSTDGTLLPLCFEIAGWAGNLEASLGSLHWIDGFAPEGEHEFSPTLLRMTREQFHCPRKLIVMTDERSHNQKWNILEDAGLAGIRDRRYSFLLDPSWGKWISTSIIAGDIELAAKIAEIRGEDGLLPLPFDEAGILHVPASLVFPTMLSRALLTTSALSPSIGRFNKYYRARQSPYLPNPEQPYEGACHHYELVPPFIADLVCRKVDACPVNANQVFSRTNTINIEL